MERRLLEALNAERRARRAAILVSDLSGGPDRLLREGEPVEGALGEAANSAFASGKSGPLSVDGRELFLAVHLPGPRLVVIGAVHIAQALAPMARIAGLAVEIVDPRTAFATPERFAGTPLDARWPDEALAERPLDRFCALAALSHDPKIDDGPILAALEAGAFYVGALGSRKTHAKRIERLGAAGASTDALGRIRAPIGLPIGAASPAEIAVSVLAEVIGALRGRRP